jgi:hypothetical protein
MSNRPEVFCQSRRAVGDGTGLRKTNRISDMLLIRFLFRIWIGDEDDESDGQRNRATTGVGPEGA